MRRWIKKGKIITEAELNLAGFRRPSEDWLRKNGFLEIKPGTAEREETEYESLVNVLIRQRYSASQEFSILRQKDEKPEEYKEYYDFCEEQKRKAKLISEE